MSRSNGSIWTVARRRVGFEANPLQRPSDRFQARARVVVALLFLVSCVLAVAVGRSAYEQEVARAQDDAVTGYHTKAEVRSTTLSAADPQSGATQRVVQVAWQSNSGEQHEQRLVIPDGRQVRSNLTIWVDGTGHASLRKPPESRTVATGLGAGFLVVFTSVFVLAVGYALVVVGLNRRRMRAWRQEWSAVEPDWRRRAL